MILKNKKAQITLFIIIGLIIFIFIFVGYYLASSANKVSETQTLERTPSSFEEYIETCMKTVAKDAIMNMGFQGGYLTVPDFIRYDLNGFLALDSQNMFGIPSWESLGESRVPEIVDMESEISAYVNDHLDFCLGNFSSFEDNYDVVPKSDKEVHTRITDDSVFIEMDYDLEVKTQKDIQTKKFERFIVSMPVKLGKMRELGKRILHSSKYNYYFEHEIIDMMSADPSIPITVMDFSLEPKRWYVKDIKERLKELIFYNFQRVRFKGTNHPPFIESEEVYEKYRGLNLMDMRNGKIKGNPPEDAYDYFNFYYDVNELPEDYEIETINFKDIYASVKFHPDRKFDLNVRPSSGGVMTTESANFFGSLISFLGFQVGHFTYDLSFLLEINLLDPVAFNGEGYLFRFAIPVRIIGNEPNREEILEKRFDNPVQFDNVCEDLSGEYDIRAIGLLQGYDNMELKDVNVSYDCYRFGCKLGQTKADGGSYRLVTGLPPSCSGGFINMQKEGYLPTRVQHTGEKQMRIKMKKVKNFNLMLNKRPSLKLDDVQPLDEDDFVVVRIKPLNYEGDIFKTFYHNTTDETIELLVDDGKYKIEIFMIDENRERIIGGYQGNFTYDYTDTFGKQSVVLSVVEYYPKQAFTPKYQMQLMEYIGGSSYTSGASPKFI